MAGKKRPQTVEAQQSAPVEDFELPELVEAPAAPLPDEPKQRMSGDQLKANLRQERRERRLAEKGY